MEINILSRFKFGLCTALEKKNSFRSISPVAELLLILLSILKFIFDKKDTHNKLQNGKQW